MTEPAPQKRIALMIGNERVSFVLNGRSRSYHLKSQQGQQLVELLRAPVQDIEAIGILADIPTWIAKQTHGRVTVDELDRLRLDGVLIDYGLTGRITKIVEQGNSFEALANFIERVSRNPDPSVAEDLYRFMEKGNLPLDPEGYVLAFKKADNEFNSFWHGPQKVNYTPGTTPSMPREECDPNRSKTCSRGLHACSFEYLNFWYKGKGRLVIVRIDPEHVTAIPMDHNDQKLRCCQMEVLAEIPEADAEHHFKSAVDSRYAPEPEVVEEDVLELTLDMIIPGETDRQRLKLHSVEEPELPIEEWVKRGYAAGDQSGRSDKEEGLPYTPDLRVPTEIEEDMDRSMAYTKALLEGYNTAYRAADDLSDSDPAPELPSF